MKLARIPLFYFAPAMSWSHSCNHPLTVAAVMLHNFRPFVLCLRLPLSPCLSFPSFPTVLLAATNLIPSTIIWSQSDNIPATFWISNGQNDYIDNVAAGSENSG